MSEAGRQATRRTSPSAERRRVLVVGTGGTISMAGASPGEVHPRFSAADLVAALGDDLDDVTVVPEEGWVAKPSSDLRLEDVVELARLVESRLTEGHDGVVVTHGTDTLEESAFALSLLVDGAIAITGAMRPSDRIDSDGPGNLRSAIAIARTPEAGTWGPLVVMGDEIHSPLFVRKTHTTAQSAFRSPLTGPVGWIAEGRVRFAVRAPDRLRIELGARQPIPEVALVALAIGEGGGLLDAVGEGGYAGLVLEAMGGGHAPRWLASRLGELADSMPVVLASRVGTGAVLTDTYGVPGAEMDLIERGLIPSGALGALKARVLLALLLASGADREAISRVFGSY